MSDENLGFLFVATTKRLPFMLLFTTKLVIVLKFAVHAFRIHLQSKPKGEKKTKTEKHKHKGIPEEASSSKRLKKGRRRERRRGMRRET